MHSQRPTSTYEEGGLLKQMRKSVPPWAHYSNVKSSPSRVPIGLLDTQTNKSYSASNTGCAEHHTTASLIALPHSGLTFPLRFRISSTFRLSSSKPLTNPFASSFFLSLTWNR